MANTEIDKLAKFILSEVPGEPSANQSAVDTAIRIIRTYQKAYGRLPKKEQRNADHPETT